MPAAIENAMAQDVEFRQGLPINYMMQLGVVSGEENEPLIPNDKEKNGKRKGKKKNVNQSNQLTWY